jgi:hypothetical protein
MGTKPKPKDTPTSVAKAAGCSRQLADRLLRRGMTRAAIIERMERQREAEAARGKVNGHAAGIASVPPFTESQARKEFHLAELRALEVAVKRGELVRLEPLRSICYSSVKYLSVRFSSLPDELRHEFGPELARVLQDRIRHYFSEAAQLYRHECTKRGMRVAPAEPPPPPHEILAYYQRYMKDSTTGEVENVSAAQQVGSYEWRRDHPSRAKDWFRIQQLKVAWDAEMAALLARRSEWDISPEPVPVPPDEAA